MLSIILKVYNKCFWYSRFVKGFCLNLPSSFLYNPAVVSSLVTSGNTSSNKLSNYASLLWSPISTQPLNLQAIFLLRLTLLHTLAEPRSPSSSNSKEWNYSIHWISQYWIYILTFWIANRLSPRSDLDKNPCVQLWYYLLWLKAIK